MASFSKFYKDYIFVIMVSCYVSMIVVYFFSSISGYEVTLLTNHFGEHWIEVGLLLSTIPDIFV